jgi:hypothetical protein
VTVDALVIEVFCVFAFVAAPRSPNDLEVWRTG